MTYFLPPLPKRDSPHSERTYKKHPIINKSFIVIEILLQNNGLSLQVFCILEKEVMNIFFGGFIFLCIFVIVKKVVYTPLKMVVRIRNRIKTML